MRVSFQNKDCRLENLRSIPPGEILNAMNNVLSGDETSGFEIGAEEHFKSITVLEGDQTEKRIKEKKKMSADCRRDSQINSRKDRRINSRRDSRINRGSNI